MQDAELDYDKKLMMIRRTTNEMPLKLYRLRKEESMGWLTMKCSKTEITYIKCAKRCICCVEREITNIADHSKYLTTMKAGNVSCFT